MIYEKNGRTYVYDPVRVNGSGDPISYFFFKSAVDAKSKIKRRKK